jgi:hypothetical protein
MRGLEGLELAKCALELRPTLAAILCPHMPIAC